MAIGFDDRGNILENVVVPSSSDVFVASLGNGSYEWRCVWPSRGVAQEFSVEESQLMLGRDAVLERYQRFGKRGDKELVLLDAHHSGVAEAVETLSREQFSEEMYNAQYFNGQKTVNFPLTAEKLMNFSRVEGMQLLGVLDAQEKLCGFACFFVKQWPDFAGDLKTIADQFAKNTDPKAYLYLVLVRPETKGDGAFEELYQRVRQASVASGNVGCAIEIHQMNTQSVIAHRRIGFDDMGTTATHDREDASGKSFPLTYRQYYQTYVASSSMDGAQRLLPFAEAEAPLF